MCSLILDLLLSQLFLRPNALLLNLLHPPTQFFVLCLARFSLVPFMFFLFLTLGPLKLIRFTDPFLRKFSLPAADRALITRFSFFRLEIIETACKHDFVLVHLLLRVHLLKDLLQDLYGLRIVQLLVDL